MLVVRAVCRRAVTVWLLALVRCENWHLQGTPMVFTFHLCERQPKDRNFRPIVELLLPLYGMYIT